MSDINNILVQINDITAKIKRLEVQRELLRDKRKRKQLHESLEESKKPEVAENSSEKEEENGGTTDDQNLTVFDKKE